MRTSVDAVIPEDEGRERSVCAPAATWHIRDFAPEDLEAAIRLDTASAMTGQRPLFEVCDLVSSLQERHPTVVAVAGGDVVGVAASRIDDDRAWVLRLSLDPRWRGLGMGSALLAELEHRLLTHGVRRITALLPQGETGTAAFLNSGFVPRENIAHFDKHETVSPRSAAILARLGGTIPPARLWEHIAGMSDEKGLIDRRIVLPHSRPEQAAEHGVVPPRAIVLFGPPGTGKTTFARAIASRLAWPFVELFSSQLGVGTGDLATGLNDAFTTLDELENVAVFIDEVEDVAARRRPESRSTTAVVNELLKCLVRFRDRPGRLLVCATNSVRELDPAFLRHGRFDCVIPIGPPRRQSPRGALEQCHRSGPHRRRRAGDCNPRLHPRRHHLRRARSRPSDVRTKRRSRLPGVADHDRLPRNDPHDETNRERRTGDPVCRRHRHLRPAMSRAGESTQCRDAWCNPTLRRVRSPRPTTSISTHDGCGATAVGGRRRPHGDRWRIRPGCRGVDRGHQSA